MIDLNIYHLFAENIYLPEEKQRKDRLPKSFLIF
jgi:hypothetical protein